MLGSNNVRLWLPLPGSSRGRKTWLLICPKASVFRHDLGNPTRIRCLEVFVRKRKTLHQASGCGWVVRSLSYTNYRHYVQQARQPCWGNTTEYITGGLSIGRCGHSLSASSIRAAVILYGADSSKCRACALRLSVWSGWFVGLIGAYKGKLRGCLTVHLFSWCHGEAGNLRSGLRVM